MDSGLLSLVIFSVILFCATWILFRQKFCKITTVLVLFYAISSICSIIFYIVNTELPFYDYSDLNIKPLIYWIFLFAATLYPVYNFEKKEKNVIKYNIKIVNIFCVLGLLFSIIPFLELLPEVTKVFGGGGADVADSISEIHDEDDKEETLSFIGHYMMRGVWVFYDISFILIYPLLKEKKKYFVSIIGVIMIILTRNLLTISTVSRTGLFTVVFHLFICILLYWPFLSKTESRKIRRIGTFVIAGFSLIFFIITIARASVYQEKSKGGEYTTSAFVARYAGEGFCNFANFAFQAKAPYGGYMTLYVPQKLLGMDPPFVDRDFLYNKAEPKQGIPQNVFYTYIGNFVLDLGPIWGAFTLLCLVFAFSCFFEVRNGEVRLSTLFLFSILLKILEFGTIGYYYSNKNSEYLLLFLFLYFILRSNKS